MTREKVDRVIIEVCDIEVCDMAGWIQDLCQSLQIPLQIANGNTEGWRWRNVKKSTWWHDLALAVPKDFEQVIDRIPEWHTDVTASRLPTAYPNDQNDSIIFDEPDAPRPPAPDPGVPHRFWGWRWRCPGCRQTSRLLFLPTPIPLPVCIRDYLDRHLPDDDRDAA